MGLPWLEAMSSAAPTAGKLAEPPLRAAFLLMPNGFVPSHFTPVGDGPDWEPTPILQPLASHKNEILLLENLWHAKTAGRNGALGRRVPACLRADMWFGHHGPRFGYRAARRWIR